MNAKAHKLKDDPSLEVYSVFERDHSTVGTVNVHPDDADEAADALERMGYGPITREERQDSEDGDPFTRIRFDRTDQ